MLSHKLRDRIDGAALVDAFQTFFCKVLERDPQKHHVIIGCGVRKALSRGVHVIVAAAGEQEVFKVGCFKAPTQITA